MSFFVYFVECSDKTIYCGFTNNLQTRISDHNNSNKGAKYTRTRRPVVLVYFEEFESKNDALKREHFLKSLTRREKIKIIESKDNLL